MKKLLLKAAVGGALTLPLFSFAQNTSPHAYVDANVGQSQYNLDTGGVTLNTQGSDPTAYKIGVGYNFTPNFGVELGYADLGKQTNTYSLGNVLLNADLKSSATYLAGTATAPMGDKFMVFGKLGASWNRSSGSVDSGLLQVSDSGRKTGLLANVGAGYKFTDNIAATVQYDTFGHIDDNNSRASMWSVGARFTF